MFSIPIFIGISKRFITTEGLTERSILKNTKANVIIEHLYPKIESGCTGFTNIRYDIRYGIYLDCDMIVLGDIEELWSYHEKNKYVCLDDGSTEVSVIDTDHLCTNKHNEHLINKSKTIPLTWNVKDEVIPNMKLLHFTSLATQPWFFDHPNKKAVEIYNDYK
ncbi:MAG: hypothetical protein ACC657_05640 [Thiohalomonadales bacterium]